MRAACTEISALAIIIVQMMTRCSLSVLMQYDLMELRGHLRGQIQDEADNGFHCRVVKGHRGRHRHTQLAAQQAGQLRTAKVSLQLSGLIQSSFPVD